MTHDDLRHSFLVQAPAGSGKTTLLVKRYLQLLNTVDYPEAVCALTFTRKAANEMRMRVQQALKTSKAPEVINLLQKNQQKGWGLLDNPHVLRIYTIDAFIQSLIKATGDLLDTEELIQVYSEVVYTTINEELLFNNLRIHLGNREDLLEQFLVKLLSKREQWIYHLLRSDSTVFDQEIFQLREELLGHAKTLLKDYFFTIRTLFAELESLNPYIPDWIKCWLSTEKVEDLSFEQFRAFAAFFLTQDDSLRKVWTKQQGVTTVQKDQSAKQRLIRLKRELGNLPLLKISPVLREILHAPENYSKYQIKILDDLLVLLPRLLANLHLYFEEHQVFDHTELVLRALAALEGEQRENVLFNWSAPINHLLIDEFQDTSWVHYRFLHHLLAPFREDRSKTLFLVGDPMQAIYGFRAAEVGLFLRAQKNDLLPLTPIFLTKNFRSAPSLINWFNLVFSKIFPLQAVVNLGAIPYARVEAEQKTDGNVVVRFLEKGSLADEAKLLMSMLQKLEQGECAILVRARSHLPWILAVLEEAGYPYQGYELATLSNSETVKDLVSLIRSMADLTDPLAWIALLRSSWCGLTAEDLSLIAWDGENNCWELLQNSEISSINQKRLDFLLKALGPIIPKIGVSSWTEIIFQAWLRLNVNASIEQYKEVEQVLSCFDEGDIDLPLVLKRVQRIFLPGIQGERKCRVQLMTIHKAKGLEFDEVIIPGMNQANPPEEINLINWWERIDEKKASHFLVGIYDPTQPQHPTYGYLRRISAIKKEYEQVRLLYVACTRAKKKLTLIGSGDKIRTGSFFYLLKPVWDNNWQTQVNPVELTVPTPPVIYRRVNVPVCDPEIEFFSLRNNLWSDNREKIGLIGLLVQQICRDLVAYGVDRFCTWTRDYWRRLAVAFSLDFTTVSKIIRKIKSNLDNFRFQWILKLRERQYQEWPISNGEEIFVIDQAFHEEGTLWLIEYKTKIHKDNYILKQEYYERLNSYYDALKNHYPKIRLGLFFPLTSFWEEVKCG